MEKQDLNAFIQQRRENLKWLQEKGIPGFGEKYSRTHWAQQVKDEFSELEGQEVSLSGRLLSKREHGKAMFGDISDQSGSVQLYLRVNSIGEDNFAIFRSLDIGDLIGITGEVFQTRRGEVTVNVSHFEVQAKSLRPLPEKWHGLKDVELRYRQRYVDLIVNPEVREIFMRRSRTIAAIRRFLDSRDFLEVETPILQPIPGGGDARPFITHHITLGRDLYLRIALELYLKKLIVGGFDRVYEIGRNFRNEGFSHKHSPEFTMLELYQVNTDYRDMMELTEVMISSVAREVLGTEKIVYQGEEIDLTPPWRRLTMIEAVEEFTGVDFSSIDLETARKAAEEKDVRIKPGLSLGEILNEFFEQKVEENLTQPTFIMDYPVEVSPLAKKIPEDPDFTYRFEGFIGGMEVANAFTELNDPIDQRERFEKQVAKREAGDEEAHMMDEDFIRALEYGMPPTGGLGIGIDRIIMVMTGSRNIREVILFPPMRPEEKDQGDKKQGE